jgi:hypothetical protein
LWNQEYKLIIGSNRMKNLTNKSTKYNIFKMKKMYSFRFEEKIIKKAKLESEKIGISLSAYICLLLRKELITTDDKMKHIKNPLKASEDIKKDIVQIAVSLKDIHSVLKSISEVIIK